MNTTTLGLDAALAHVGYAVLVGGVPVPELCGVWSHGPREGTEEERQEAYGRDLRRLLEQVHTTVGPNGYYVRPPSLACIEGQFLHADPKRARSVIVVAAMRGYCVGVLQGRGIPCVTVRPQDAKLALAGTGRAKKEEMVEAARRRWGLELQEKDEHLADAIGMALAGEARARVRGWRVVGGGSRGVAAN